MSMECERIRRRIDDGEPDAAAAAHMERCPACRAEAAFARRLTAAVANLPQQRAPADLLARVMADVQAPEQIAAMTRPTLLSLRPWELCGLAVLSLALLVLLPGVLGQWVWPENGAASWSSILTSAGASAWTAGTSARVTWESAWQWWESTWRGVLTGSVMGGNLPWLSWALGVAAFALALYWLLSWRSPESTPEDGHAATT
jgi:anti-sigma factor RsiW